MRDPVVKREDSPDTSVMAIPPALILRHAAVQLTVPSSFIADTDPDDVKPPATKLSGIIEEPPFTPAAHSSSSLGCYELDDAARNFPRAFAPLARLPAQASPVAVTRDVNKQTPLAPATTSSHPTSHRITKILAYHHKERDSKRPSNMEARDFYAEGAASQELHFSPLGIPMGSQGKPALCMLCKCVCM